MYLNMTRKNIKKFTIGGAGVVELVADHACEEVKPLSPEAAQMVRTAYYAVFAAYLIPKWILSNLK